MILAAFFLFGLFTGLAFAEGQMPPYPVLLSGSLGGLVGTPSPFGDSSSLGAGASGRLIFHKDRWGFEVGARSLYASADAREVGALFFGGRLALTDTLYAHLGFAHNHETELALVKENPVMASLGSLPGIRHRSGAEIGVGLNYPIEEAILKDRLGFCADLGLSAFPDALGPRVYVFAEAGLSLSVGKRRD